MRSYQIGSESFVKETLSVPLTESEMYYERIRSVSRMIELTHSVKDLALLSGYYSDEGHKDFLTTRRLVTVEEHGYFDVCNLDYHSRCDPCLETERQWYDLWEECRKLKNCMRCDKLLRKPGQCFYTSIYCEECWKQIEEREGKNEIVVTRIVVPESVREEVIKVVRPILEKIPERKEGTTVCIKCNGKDNCELIEWRGKTLECCYQCARDDLNPLWWYSHLICIHH